MIDCIGYTFYVEYVMYLTWYFGIKKVYTMGGVYANVNFEKGHR